MAKSSNDGANEKVNKSEEIRTVLRQNPKAKSKEIVSVLAARGIKVAPSLIYMIKSKEKHQKRKQKRELVAATSRATGTINPAELVIKVKRLANEAGGIRYLKQLVDALAEY